MGKLRCKAVGWVGAGREESQQWGCKQRECVCFEVTLKAPGPRAGLVLKSGFAPPCEIVEGLEGSLGGCRGRFSPRVLCALHQLRSFFGWLFFSCAQPGTRLQTGEMKMSSHLLRRRSSRREMEEKRREIKQK